MTSSRAHLRFDVGGADGRLIGILQDAIAAWGFAARSLFRSFRLSWTKILAIANGPALDSASSLVAAGSSLHHQHIGPSPWLQLASTPFLGPGWGPRKKVVFHVLRRGLRTSCSNSDISSVAS